MSIHTNIQSVLLQLPPQARLVAVSKTYPPNVITEAYNAGHRIFGENKVQELIPKYESLPKDIEWHFIGHLQSNKVKYIAPFVSMIHSVDSLKLLAEIDREAKKNNRMIDVLLEFYIAREQTKFGLSLEEAVVLLSGAELPGMQNIRIRGLMGMASFSDNMVQVRNEFRFLKTCFNELKEKFFSKTDHFNELSMGMSDDYLVAIGEGSTLIRVGSLIFGKRG